MWPMRLEPTSALVADLAPHEAAIARSVLYAALFDYPLRLSQLRQTLIGSRQTPSDILASIRDSPALASVVEHRDGFFFPAGRHDLVAVRHRREIRSRAFLARHTLLLRAIGSLPFVRMVALSGSIAHFNLQAGGDLDLFIVTRGRRVWATTVIVILLSKLLRRRSTLCANLVVADTSLAFSPADLFTASQIVGLRPVTGGDVMHRVLAANSCVREHFPNFHVPPPARPSPVRQARRLVRHAVEAVLTPGYAMLERICRWTYRAYLRRRARTWSSPEQVVLGDEVLKLHTRSHRQAVLQRFGDVVNGTAEH